MLSENQDKLIDSIRQFLNSSSKYLTDNDPLATLFITRKALRESSLSQEQVVWQMLMESIDELSQLHV